MRLGVLGIVLCLPASAQEVDQPRYDAMLDACYYGAEGPAEQRGCIGLAAQSCQSEDGGQTTLGMALCNHAERMAWDRILNAEYRETLGWARAMDADEAVSFPEFAKREENLRAAQRAWIAFRDAECALDYAVWGAGSMRHIAGTACLARLTAERTLELADKTEMMR
ncbi:MAG: lysozyme inhibitor LprI family protein [Pseudomonadota bacterium]